MEPNATTPGSTGPSPITKHVDQVEKALAMLYKECYKAEPDGPACEAVLSLQKAVAEIDRMTGGDGMPAEAPIEEVPVEQSGPMSFDQAGVAAADRMQAGAQERAMAQAQMAGM